MNLQLVVSIASAVAQLIPTAITFVETAEAAFPQSGQGAAKLGMVVNVMKTIYAQGSNVAATWEQIQPALQVAINEVVAIKNALGAFKTQPASAPVQPAPATDVSHVA